MVNAFVSYCTDFATLDNPGLFYITDQEAQNQGTLLKKLFNKGVSEAHRNRSTQDMFPRAQLKLRSCSKCTLLFVNLRNPRLYTQTVVQNT